MLNQLRLNGSRAKTAITMMWIMLALEIIQIFSDYLEYDLLRAAVHGEAIHPAAAEMNDIRQGIFGFIYAIAFIVTVVVFIRWFRRAYFNLHVLVPHLSFSEGWAAGSWFVPILSLFRPYQIMKELYDETKRLLTESGHDMRHRLSTVSVGWWWGFWIVTGFIEQVAFRLMIKDDTAAGLMTVNMFSMISGVLSIPLSLLAIKVIRDYAEAEPLLFDVSGRQQPEETPGVVL